MSGSESMLVSGLIIRSQSGFFTIETETGQMVCHLRGRLKRGPRLGDIAAVGDRVRISCQSASQGRIEGKSVV